MRSATPTQRLWIASHVRACEIDGQIILLDLCTSKYLGVPQASTLATLVEGWPEGPTTMPDRSVPADVGVLTRHLVSRGLLTSTPPPRPRPTSIDEATSSLDWNDGDVRAPLNAQRVGRFVRAATVTALWMRCRSLQTIAAAVETRRERHMPAAVSGTLDAMAASIAVYERLRPFAFTTHQNCLYDSLALLDFLALEGAFPQWVIGVQTRPFGAHSWVQCGGTVLNDEHERVRRFRPILVV